MQCAEQMEEAIRELRAQVPESHAAEIETALMLYVEPSAVDMHKAVRHLAPLSNPLRLTRLQGRPGTYSPSGILGDPTRATTDLGRALSDAEVKQIHDLENGIRDLSGR
jgi:creatinine amidohydrolase/Fe(II)-dependent formamide hydrolase-like protein